jgi:hypothetical protein
MALAADIAVLLGFAAGLALTMAIVWRGTRRIPASATMLITWRGGRARAPKGVAVAIWTIAPIMWTLLGVAIGTTLFFRSPGAGLGILLLAAVQPVIVAASVKAAIDDLEQRGLARRP